MSPLRYVCVECDFLLFAHNSDSLVGLQVIYKNKSFSSVEHVNDLHKGVCPECGHVLAKRISAGKVTIKPIKR